jgi:hypothetical protein
MDSNPWRGADSLYRAFFDTVSARPLSSSQQNLFPIGDNAPEALCKFDRIAIIAAKNGYDGLGSTIGHYYLSYKD